MIKLCVIGWYGTETMGDRAILDGILHVFYELCGTVSVKLGSLYPGYSSRTFVEEQDVFNNSCPEVSFSLFHIKDKAATDAAVDQSDVVVFGGGPIMDNPEMVLMTYAFRRAKCKGIPTILLGCGFGPVHKENDPVIRELFQLSDLVTVRDYYSKKEIERLNLYQNEVKCTGDPAMISVANYIRKKGNVDKADSTLAINFRKFPKSEYTRNTIFDEEYAFHIIEQISKAYEKVLMVPMHTFSFGGDDRQFFADVLDGKTLKNVSVQYKISNLWELYDIYATGTACIGMRYHSVLMQTLLNGNNVIMNYTQNAGNKIDGFLSYCDLSMAYQDRRWDMESEIDASFWDNLSEPVKINREYDEIIKSCDAIEGVLK